MIQISLITSLYRTEQHLPTYIDRARHIAGQVRAAGFTLEFVLIANDATEAERQLLADFERQDAAVTVLHVPRESVYASWNRGVQQAQGAALGFWNVDDERTAEGIIEGYRRLAGGCDLVYFSHTVIRTRAGSRRTRQRTYPAVPYDRDLHRRVMKCGPFFMFRPDLYRRVGPFDARFRIAGDAEWCARATDYTDFCPLPLIAGYFYLHGGNLSDTGNPLQLAETNIICLMQGAYERLIPVDPEIMRQTWAKWGEALPVPDAIQGQLWGDGAAARARAWQQQQQRQRLQLRLSSMIRYLPKQFIDRTGLRPLLAKTGLVKNRPPTGPSSDSDLR